MKFREAALVDLLLPDDVIGVFGALLQDTVLDARQNDAGVGTGALAHARVGGAAVAAPLRVCDTSTHQSGTFSVGGSPNKPAQKS